MPQLNAPTLLTADHQVDGFDSGKPSLDDWLKRRALKNQTEGASRTYVVTNNDGAVLSYYALAAGSVIATEATGAVRRNMPSPIPVVILARLAVDRSLQSKGFGTALLRDALLKTVRAANTIGVRALLIHALDEDAAAFYQKFGFSRSPADSLMLMMPLKSVIERLSEN
ncbi:MAG: GNAT family N-acetyltransferase [Hyphomonas sp.]|uniref:GNAT family N-acetyltransferase n=1 Tax=Hyphomonas sp. TaxID=87 RepID=UPI00184484CF|nr:GNAT family N-acetyltransferase [Hyphomonas sp.]MBA3069155.1 GNAT family N-acetyltransferase [Hyphomonas sp.]MBU3920190.1 GNAT family N-acetyltransferase [Alphaproteobacteria bacterium]MBU4062340.1 GNAT family N-acetyltransferase [Alphaproteobacteria bacterium]MBU4162722.1 GNAT family N-acetyltransferase [Alphaproteobacteria bacterium]